MCKARPANCDRGLRRLRRRFSAKVLVKELSAVAPQMVPEEDGPVDGIGVTG